MSRRLKARLKNIYWSVLMKLRILPIERVWITRAQDQDAAISASEVAFFDWLKRQSHSS
jgi:hypothetical protein